MNNRIEIIILLLLGLFAISAANLYEMKKITYYIELNNIEEIEIE